MNNNLNISTGQKSKSEQAVWRRQGSLRLTYRKQKLALTVALIIGLLLGGSDPFTEFSAQASAPNKLRKPDNADIVTFTGADIVTFTGNGLYDTEEKVGVSKLLRTKEGIFVKLNTSKLIPGGVYTYWWVVFDEPGNEDSLLIAWAAGMVAKKNGKSHAISFLKPGQEGIDGNPAVFVDGGEPGMNNPLGSQVVVEIVYHGQINDLPHDPELAKQWFTTFWVGDEAICDIDFPSPNGKTCPTAQIVDHLP